MFFVDNTYFCNTAYCRTLNSLIMKKRIILVIGIVVTAGIALLCSSNNKNEVFMKNLEALSQGEGYPICTGPKKENLSGNIFCHCENQYPCQDNQGCQ